MRNCDPLGTHVEKMYRTTKKDSFFRCLCVCSCRSYMSVPNLRSSIESYLCDRFIEQVSQWHVHKTASPFTRRVTALEWHPVYPDVVAVGSHGGDILLWKYDNAACDDPFIKGVGMGYGSITDMKFHPTNHNLIYTTAVDGRFCLQDFEGRHSDVYLDTMDINYWWCSFDISLEHQVLCVGDNHGALVLLDKNGQSIGKYSRLHKGKVKHVEFCPSRSWILATGSVDRTVALWDIRMMKSDFVGTGVSKQKETNAITVLEHSAPVSSAYFDPIFGSRLLTTSQNGEIRLYESHNLWEEPIVIVDHTHRHFQHITDIKATWHPLYRDICVVGRYPKKDDSDQTRTIDLINIASGELSGTVYCPSLSGIIQLNKFNKLGDSLASGMGYSALIWKPPTGLAKVTAVEEAVESKKGDLLHLLGTNRATSKRATSKRKRPIEDTKNRKMKLISASVTKIKKR